MSTSSAKFRSSLKSFLFVVSCIFAVTAAPDLGWAIPARPGCNEIAINYQNEMTVPFKTFADSRVRKCIKRQSVTSLNIPLFIATAFYDRNLNERAQALSKLRAYECETENTCKRLFETLDTHLKATRLTKTKDSVELFTQLDSLRGQLHYELNSID